MNDRLVTAAQDPLLCNNDLHRYSMSGRYLQDHAMAESRFREGWKNKRCPDCRIFGWEPPAGMYELS